MSKTLANLRDLLSQKLDDYLQSTVTTAISTSRLLIDTALANKRGGTVDDAYNDWYALITSLSNDGQLRIISDYTGSSQNISCQGNAFASDGAGLATYEIHRFDPDLKTRCINEAAKELYPVLFKHLRDRTLITGNWLFDGSFEDWTSTTALDRWISSDSSISQTSTDGFFRSGEYSAKVTASATGGALLFKSDKNPHLKDLIGETVTFRAWARPSVSNDAELLIAYTDASGASVLNYTSCDSEISQWNLLEKRDFNIPSTALDVWFGLVVQTSGANAYFDDARVIGQPVYEYELPNNFESGKLLKVSYQESGNTNQQSTNQFQACDNIRGERYVPAPGYEIRYDGAAKFLQFNKEFPKEHRLELEGYMPLESTLSADTDIMTIDDPYTELIVSYAAMLLYEKLGAGAPWDSSNYFYTEYVKWRDKMLRLKRTHRMTKPDIQSNRSL